MKQDDLLYVMVVKKVTSECLLIDIAVPGDVQVKRKEDEKVEKYRGLCRELGRLWFWLPSYLALLDINLSLKVL